MNTKIKWITQTGVLTALLIILQLITSGFGNTLITGSVVNMMLILSVMTSGLSTGLSVAALSPIFAKLIGIGPFWTLIPFIMLGNIVLVVLWHLITQKSASNKQVRHILACIIGAVSKFIVIYIGVVQIAIPLILQLPEKQAAVVSASFSIPQLITALIGGVLAMVILPFIQRAFPHK